jgi:hypothetical protein
MLLFWTISFIVDIIFLGKYLFGVHPRPLLIPIVSTCAIYGWFMIKEIISVHTFKNYTDMSIAYDDDETIFYKRYIAGWGGMLSGAVYVVAAMSGSLAHMEGLRLADSKVHAVWGLYLVFETWRWTVHVMNYHHTVKNIGPDKNPAIV